MKAEDVQIRATPEAREKLSAMLRDCSGNADCLHLAYATSAENENPDGTTTQTGPHWLVGWNLTAEAGHLPYWVKVDDLVVFFPQFHLYEEVNGKLLHYEDETWFFLTP